VVKMENAGEEILTVGIGSDGAVIVHGDIDIAGGPVLDDLLRTCENSNKTLVLDLHDVSFIDSSGLRSLLNASRRAQDRGSSVVLRGVGPEVARLLDITGTTEQFVVELRS
jgi:anti-sigma B factor antagonist